jgi:hypothetical protein
MEATVFRSRLVARAFSARDDRDADGRSVGRRLGGEGGEDHRVDDAPAMATTLVGSSTGPGDARTAMWSDHALASRSQRIPPQDEGPSPDGPSSTSGRRRLAHLDEHRLM